MPTLSIRRGELMTLLGPSGCGKTTLLNLVAGFLVPDSGEIEIDGKRVNDIPTYKREIGMMFQNYALFPHMSVAANVGYGLRMRGVAKPEIARRVAEALALVQAHRRGGPPAAPALGRPTAARGAGARACRSRRRYCCSTSPFPRSTGTCAPRCRSRSRRSSASSA